MHELGVVIEIIKTVEDFAARNNVQMIETLVLQIGQLSSMVPAYIEQCYPAAIENTILEDTKLKIEIIPANGLCNGCGKVFNIISERKKCPHCGLSEFELLSGKEFLIKEIVAC